MAHQIGSSATDAHAKALAVNLDAGIYGSIAEIGAGQEVARWFLTAGGASGTVARPSPPTTSRSATPPTGPAPGTSPAGGSEPCWTTSTACWSNGSVRPADRPPGSSRSPTRRPPATTG